MNERIIKLALKSGMLNYVDNETPRHYFLSGNADEECLNEFAELIVRECATVARNYTLEKYPKLKDFDGIVYIEEAIKEHFKK
jgi:hypothetical protein